MLTRREAIAGLGALGGQLILPWAGAAQEPSYLLGEWTGDNFAPMHAIRDGLWRAPLPAPERRVEVAIIGGGLAGLAVATLLKDRDLLVLERELEPGGVAKCGRWRNVDYALGSAYIVDLSEPFGAFYEMLGLAPRPVGDPVDRVMTGTAGEGDPREGEWRGAYESLKALLRRLAESRDFPKIPIAEASQPALALDGLSLLEFLRSEHIDARLFGLLDSYCLSALGAPAADISAYAGVNFLSEINTPIYAFPGGNAAIARAMAARLSNAGAGRIVTGAAVYAIEPAEGGYARIGWFDVRNPEELRCLEARWAVVAAPYFFAGRILRGVDPAATAKMTSLRQGSYLVANCCFEGPPTELPYDNWALGAQSFCDAVRATAALPSAERPKDHGVLTVYAPFRDPRAGRERLLAGDRADFAAPIVEELRRFLPETFGKARLTEVRLTRWGHHHLIAAPGIVTTMRALPKRFGNVLLAHSDGQGLPAVESAIVEAQNAVEIIKRG
ncbi:MAG: twin-arginine translocation pathway signal [Alphaproteobacteria bacterium]|nr:twin-arginine translocation pathway signal [Alphaproteobacteria bacterium]MBM3640218.1 twin-arginine translocation pathway signal [Alphaproteobacteria bacterium]